MKSDKIVYCKTAMGKELMINASDIFNMAKGDSIKSLKIGTRVEAKRKLTKSESTRITTK